MIHPYFRPIDPSRPAEFAQRLLAAVLLVSAIAIPTARADDNLLQTVTQHAANMWKNGDTEVYLAGWAHHGRSTYSKQKLDELNERAWGLGYGRILRNARGNDESLFGMVIKDSHNHPQYMAGYAHEWIFSLIRSGLELGIGGTAMLISRQDYFHNLPFPAPLPLVSIGKKNAKLTFAYVPRLSANKNNGDVLLVFGRIN